jgi:hypothetical protein
MDRRCAAATREPDMNSATVQMEAAQFGLLQRTQKYEDAAALRLVETATSEGGQHQAAPPPTVPPVQPISAAPREGSTIHVIA